METVRRALQVALTSLYPVLFCLYMTRGKPACRLLSSSAVRDGRLEVPEKSQKMVMKSIIIILFLTLFPSAIYPAAIDYSKYNDRAGSYQLLIRGLNPIIDPGGIVSFEVYVVGNGIIKACNVRMTPSIVYIDNSSSRVYYGYQKTANMNNLRYGVLSQPISSSGFIVRIPEVMFKKIDLGDGFPQTLMERKEGRAPLEIYLKTKERILPGNYSCDLYLTYFNGYEWKTDSQKINFTVRNFLQRNELTIALVIALAAFMTIIRSLTPLLQYLFPRNKKRSDG